MIQCHDPTDIIGLEHFVCPHHCLGELLESLIAAFIDVGFMPCNVTGKWFSQIEGRTRIELVD